LIGAVDRDDLVKKRAGIEQQGNLFGEVDRRSRERQRQKKEPAPAKESRDGTAGKQNWSMPDPRGSTVASLRLLWPKRLTPAQIAQVEAEIAALPRMLTNLGFGRVLLERASVRRKKG
jgi:hypothetical protein